MGMYGELSGMTCCLAKSTQCSNLTLLNPKRASQLSFFDRFLQMMKRDINGLSLPFLALLYKLFPLGAPCTCIIGTNPTCDVSLVTFAKAQWMGGWTSGCKGWTSGCCFTESCDSYPRPKLYTKKRPKRSKKMIQSIYLFGQVPQNLGNPDKNGALLYGGRTPSKLTKHRPLKLTWNTEIN